MAIQIQCDQCGKTLQVQDALAGKKVKCPCGAVLTAAAGPPGTGVKRPTATPRAPAAGGAANPYSSETSDLSGLFDELTESDFQPLGGRREAADGGAPAKDPLAGYGGDSAPRRTGGSITGGLIAVIVCNVLLGILLITIGISSLVGAEWVTRIEPLSDPDTATITAAVLLAYGAVFVVVAGALPTLQPWVWWLALFVWGFDAVNRILAIVLSVLDGTFLDNALFLTVLLLLAGGITVYLLVGGVRQRFKIKTSPLVASAIVFGIVIVIALLFHFLPRFLNVGD